MDTTSGTDSNRDRGAEQWSAARHELGNVSMLIDAALRVPSLDDQASRLLAEARRRIDVLISTEPAVAAPGSMESTDGDLPT